MKFDAITTAGFMLNDLAKMLVMVGVSWVIAVLIIWESQSMTGREQICFFIGFVVGGLVLFGCNLVIG